MRGSEVKMEWWKASTSWEEIKRLMRWHVGTEEELRRGELVMQQMGKVGRRGDVNR
jgi:hypothetical protein